MQYELMFHGWLPANVNTVVRNARNIDVIAIRGQQQVALSVKTSGFQSDSNFQLGGDSGSPVFNRHAQGPQAHFVCFVVLSAAQSRGYDCYVVPVDVAERAVLAADAHWLQHPKRDNTPRKPGIRGIRFTGQDTVGNISAGFARKWAQYRDAWHLLDELAAEHIEVQTATQDHAPMNPCMATSAVPAHQPDARDAQQGAASPRIPI